MSNSEDLLSAEKTYKNALLPLYIIDVLKRHSHENRRLKQEDIVKYLQKDHEIKITRQTLAKYLDAMRWQEKKERGLKRGEKKVLDYHIRSSKEQMSSSRLKSVKLGKKYKEREVYIQNDVLSNLEISMLCDGVLYSKHIAQEDKKRLIEILKSFSPMVFKDKYKYVQSVGDVLSAKNDNMAKNLERIERAISENKRIRITMGRFVENINTREYEMKKGEKMYTVSPYYIVTSLSRYYLICVWGDRGTAGNIRIDRMFSVDILEEERGELDFGDENLSSTSLISDGDYLKKYMREHIYMYAGKSRRVEFRILAEHVGHFIDWYGTKEITTVVEKQAGQENGYVRLTVSVNENAMYHWAIQYGEMVEILSPKDLRERVKKGLEGILKKYNCDGDDV